MNRIHGPKHSTESSRFKPSTKLSLSEDGKSRPRKRNNSLIPAELMMSTSGEAGRECAALATVFGVPEYVNSKIFWDRQQEKSTKTGDKHSHLIINKENTTQVHEISSYVDSVLNSVATFDPVLGPTPQATKSFKLPKIPNVSKFNDLLDDDELIIPANPSSIIIPPGVGSQSNLSIKNGTLKPNQENSRPVSTDDISLKENNAAFILGPHEIFDFITSDEDERFIVWGPDPIVLSSSMATATTSTIDRPSSYATLYNSQYEKPLNKGFSSNTTTTTSAKNKPTKHQKINRFGSIRLSDLKRPSKRPMYNLLPKEQEKPSSSGSFLFKKAFGIKRGNKIASNDTSSISTTAQADIPKVIEAATIHKLIEKLTSTLDYAFMTDFFLTYRDFIQSQELCQLLISRFTWALQNDEEKRRIVRIRTFVVFRHWLSNYFVHDFVGNYDLRNILASFLNDLSCHPLVKTSPRDQRIIKTLKRVVRRLKKLYYVRSSAASRVKVISPPPPTMEQKHMSEKVRAKLSQNAIRRKTAIRMDMGTDHHGNMAVQDARHAPVRVVGSLNMRGSLIESGVASPTKSSQLRRYASQISTPSTVACPIEPRPLSSIQKSIHDEESKTYKTISASSSVSGDSLDSDITAGTTLPDDEEYDEEEDELQSQQQSMVTENNEPDLHWIREQQETLEYFKTLNKKDPVESLDSNTPINSDLFTESLSSPRQSRLLKLSLVQKSNTVSDNSGPTSPVTPVESQPSPDSIRRISSEKWSKRSPSDDPNKRLSETKVSKTLPEELLKELDVKDAESPLGISRKLSEKSIERRKSEKNLQASANESIPESKIPDMPVLKNNPHLNNLAEKDKTDILTAIPYEQTEDLNQHDNQPAAEDPKSFSKKNLSKAISKVFKSSNPHQPKAPKEKQVPLVEPSVVTPDNRMESPPAQKTENNKEAEQEEEKPQQGNRFVSLIAEQLRVNMSGDEIAATIGCECIKCSGRPDAPKACKRPSLTMLAEDERRYSFDLRRKRGASIDWSLQPSANLFNNDTQSTLQKPDTPKGKPVYLGQLDTRSIIESCVNKNSNSNKRRERVYSDGGDDDDDDQSIDSLVPSERSTPADTNAESSQAGEISLASDSNVLRSKIVELDIPPLSVSRIQDDDGQPSVEASSSIPRSIPIKATSGKSFIMYYRTSKLASQFCYIERDVLVKVGWEELIHCKWTKMDANGKIDACFTYNDMVYEENAGEINYTRQNEKMRAQEQGIEYVIQRFNTVCLWVSSEIVRTRNINDRVKLIEKFIRLAMKCKDYSNYATLVQILLGLQSPTVAHLEKTWSKVSVKYQKQLGKLTEFSSPMKNWKHIRDSMTEVAEEYGNSPAEVQVEMPGTTADKERFKKTRVKMPFGGCIPFLGIYLSDLVFNSEKPRYLKPNSEKRKIYDANATKNIPLCLEQPLVNFRKYRVIATVIKRVLIFQGLAIRYSFDQDPSLKDQCRNLNVLDANVIRELSAKLQ
ncbi:Guanine nucleotide exchange factor lte1 [Rhizopus stolonifer]|uniref:Guanine nucleotide exchange factor lte1 n=1 Tax=Rhizopus stolonifer TaxID=4846 RepID=A0A367KP64_RHIST|nr:Guanine nucleotide exchange factor lte1 [Rhizopus stolonifer]